MVLLLEVWSLSVCVLYYYYFFEVQHRNRSLLHIEIGSFICLCRLSRSNLSLVVLFCCFNSVTTINVKSYHLMQIMYDYCLHYFSWIVHLGCEYVMMWIEWAEDGAYGWKFISIGWWRTSLKVLQFCSLIVGDLLG